MTSTTTAARASAADTARLLAAVLLPTIAGGVIKRRPRLIGLVGLLGGDERAVRAITRLRDRYGDTPLALRVPGREVAIVLSPEDVGALLAATPDPFTPASTDKIAALQHFQPHAVLITRDEHVRAKRRAANEKALDTGRPLHHLADPIHRVVTEEAAALSGRTLDWHRFDITWQRVVRRIVLGDAARDDVRLTELLDRLRRTANWAWLAPRRPRLLSEFTERLRAHVERGDPDSIAAGLSHGAGAEVDPVEQVPHWLFAFDAAGMATMRTLAVLATHPDAAARAETGTGEPARLPFLRACVLDTLRLWPTTPVLLRETTTRTWGLPANTTMLVFAPYFHRAVSNRFEPDLWLTGRAQSHPALVPFSGGPGQCPGQDLVLYTTSTMLAALRTHRDYALVGDHGLRDRAHLPGTLDNFHLEFRAAAR